MHPQTEGINTATLLATQSMRGGGYLAARYGLGVLVGAGNMLVLTWWIGPHAYGLFVTAIGLVAFLSTLARAGLDTYLVRCPDVPDKQQYEIASALIFFISLGLVLFGAAIVPLLITWYGSREFVAPYLVLLINIPVTGITGLPTAKLERELAFLRVAGIELSGQTVGLVLSASIALLGGGIWAAVAGQLAWQVFILIASCVAAKFLPRLRFDRQEAQKMLSYGLSLTLSLRAWQLRTLVNPLLVGRFAGPEGVAFVGLAIRIAESLGTIRLAAGRVAIATLSRLQHQRDEFQAALGQALYVQIITLGPLLCAFVLLGPFAIHHVIGERWMLSLAVYPFIAAGVLVNSIYNLQASALFVLGKQWLVLRAFAMHVALLALATLFLVPRIGVVGYGWAELLGCAAYPLLQNEITGAIRYRKFLPWTLVFLVLLFAPANWRLAIAGIAAFTAVWMAFWKHKPLPGLQRALGAESD